MNEAVFISDLHLNPSDPIITERFFAFIQWAAAHTKTLYILGDFLHVWPGDDALDSWSEEIASQLAWLSLQGVTVYFMPGNRDFLLGKKFLSISNMQSLDESTVIKLGDKSILLVHGDMYCTRDKPHQWLRLFTRNRLFITLFLLLPYKFRFKVVNNVREYSQNNRQKPVNNMLVVVSSMLRHLKRFNAYTVIHGHTHKPGLTIHHDSAGEYKQYVLSDWDKSPLLMCYNITNDFYFYRFGEVV